MCMDFKMYDDGLVLEINVTIDMEFRAVKSLKGIFYWVMLDFVKGECRLYNNFFIVEIFGKVDVNVE